MSKNKWEDATTFEEAAGNATVGFFTLGFGSTTHTVRDTDSGDEKTVEVGYGESIGDKIGSGDFLDD